MDIGIIVLSGFLVVSVGLAIYTYIDNKRNPPKSDGIPRGKSWFGG